MKPQIHQNTCLFDLDVEKHPNPVSVTTPPALQPDPSGPYFVFYKTLGQLREEFHRTGRYDDANAKLDEIVRLIVMLIHEQHRAASGQANRLTDEYLRDFARRSFGDSKHIAKALLALSEDILSDPSYRNPDGTSIFGAHPRLTIQPTDDSFAQYILSAARNLSAVMVEPVKNDGLHQFDILNESFGHFIRDSFRNHKEDAQYMTPPEVVSAMAEILFADVDSDPVLVDRLLSATSKNPFRILDPTCGVGSFLVEALRRMLKTVSTQDKLSGHRLNALASTLRDSLVGQDKVDRMVRLAKLNLMLFGGGGGTVFQGNSILNGSTLDELHSGVDVILTNPPFGARYCLKDVLRPDNQLQFPMLHSFVENGNLSLTSIVDSEVILLDRCLSLLRPGGRLAIVLPDSLISAKGVSSVVRKWVMAHADLFCAVELPSVTFAQAGTRTKTCFVCLRKFNGTSKSSGRVFMAVCDNIGYRVAERAGASVKIAEGSNQLPAIVDAYRRTASIGPKGHAYNIVNRDPSCVWLQDSELLNGRWTPNFYRPQRLEAIVRVERLAASGFVVEKLSDVARLASRVRRRSPALPGAKVISVLHISQDGMIDLREVEKYNPKCPGLPCRAGDVLLSKINPRIPRVCVVPEVATPLTCSTEFEILEPRPDVDPYLLASLLLSPAVQTQIECLTSGTSSSHNRIKDSELAQILIPLPKKGSSTHSKFKQLGRRLRESLNQKYTADLVLKEARDELAQLLGEEN